jgi:hypothetical protein
MNLSPTLVFTFPRHMTPHMIFNFPQHTVRWPFLRLNPLQLPHVNSSWLRRTPTWWQSPLSCLLLSKSFHWPHFSHKSKPSRSTEQRGRPIRDTTSELPRYALVCADELSSVVMTESPRLRDFSSILVKYDCGKVSVNWLQFYRSTHYYILTITIITIVCFCVFTFQG